VPSPYHSIVSATRPRERAIAAVAMAHCIGTAPSSSAWIIATAASPAPIFDGSYPQPDITSAAPIAES
jgi:hypothetical protein